MTSSVYASTDPGSTARVVVVAINKSKSAKTTAIQLTATQLYTKAEIYTMTNGSPAPVRQPDVTLAKRNAFVYTMPAMSVSTIVDIPDIGVPRNSVTRPRGTPPMPSAASKSANPVAITGMASFVA